MCQFENAKIGQSIEGNLVDVTCENCGHVSINIPFKGRYAGHVKLNGKYYDMVDIPGGLTCPQCGKISSDSYFPCEDFKCLTS